MGAEDQIGFDGPVNPNTWIGEVDMAAGGRRLYTFRRTVSYSRVQWIAQLCGKGCQTYFSRLEDGVRHHLVNRNR